MRCLLLCLLPALLLAGTFTPGEQVTRGFAAVAWSGAAATCVTGVLCQGRADWPVQLSASVAVGGIFGTLASGEWMLKDAPLHFAASGAIYAAGYVGARQFLRPLPAGLAAGAFTLGLGALKEWRDSRQPRNRWDWQDVKWNCVGVATSALVTAGIDALMHRNR